MIYYPPRESVIILGGAQSYEDNGVVQSAREVYEYNIPSKIFVRKKCKVGITDEFPKSRRSAAAILHGNSIYIFGGVHYYLLTTREMDVWELNLNTFRWKKHTMKEKPEKRYSHCCVRLDKYRVLTGFGQFHESYNDIYVLHLHTMKWYTRVTFGSDTPSPRGYCSATKHENEIYVFGGRNLSQRRYNTLHCLSTINWRWKKIDLTFTTFGKQLLGIAGHCSFILENKLFIFGGNTDEGKSNKLYEICLFDTMRVNHKCTDFVDVIIRVYED